MHRDRLTRPGAGAGSATQPSLACRPAKLPQLPACTAQTAPEGSAPAASAPGRPLPTGEVHHPGPGKRGARRQARSTPAPFAKAPAEATTSVTRPRTHRGNDSPGPSGPGEPSAMEGGRCPRPGPLDGSPAPGSSSSSSRPRLGDHGSSFGRTPGAAQPALLPGSLARSPGETFPGSSEDKLPPRTLRTERQPSATRMEREGKGWLAGGEQGGEHEGWREAEGEAGGEGERGGGFAGAGAWGEGGRRHGLPEVAAARARPRPLPCSRACAGKSSQGSFGAGRLRGVFASPCS